MLPAAWWRWTRGASILQEAQTCLGGHKGPTPGVYYGTGYSKHRGLRPFLYALNYLIATINFKAKVLYQTFRSFGHRVHAGSEPLPRIGVESVFDGH